MNSLTSKYIAEFFGTMILVIFGCGTAMFSGNYLCIALAFGLSIVIVGYTFGKVSGCHLNPAVSFAFFVDGKMKVNEFVGYVISQIAGSIAGTLILVILVLCGALGEDYDGKLRNDIGDSSFGANGFGDMNFFGALLAEIILTTVFVLVVLYVVQSKEEAIRKHAILYIGTALTFVHILGIGLTGTSVNPARSIGPALFAISNTDGSSIAQVWVFIVGPLAGGFIASLVYSIIGKKTNN